MGSWVTARLGRVFGFALGLVLLSALLVFLALFIGAYQWQIGHERTRLSEQTALLLQAALENAMLKRDLPGLQTIVDRLGQQEGVRQVLIVNPSGEVRFASNRQMLNHHFLTDNDSGCRECHQQNTARGRTLFMVDKNGQEVLRGVDPVRNREPCQQCHGPLSEHPINGVLIIDYDAAAIRTTALHGALAFLGAGAMVVLLVTTTLWWLLRRRVLDRLEVLGAANRAVERGVLDVRVPEDGRDEIADLARGFNEMTETLRARMRDIRDREAFLQAMIDAVPDGLRVIAANSMIVTANRTYRRQLGLDDSQPLAGQTCYNSSHGASEPCPPTLIACPLNILAREKEPLKTVHQHIRRDGSTVHMEVYAAPMMLEQQGRESFYVVESIRDLSEDIRFSHGQKLSSVGQLAAGVAHEIRNPLASIRLALEGLLRDIEAGGTSAEVLTYLRLVDGQIDKCIDVSNRLLKLSAVGGEQKTLVDIGQAVEETLSLVHWHAETLGIEIIFTPDPSSPRILAVDGDVRMVALNLIQNSFHSMPTGGRLLVDVRSDAKQVALIVTDTGVGIKPEYRRHIFEPFFSHRADTEQGTGLGLAICKSIVEGLSGSIHVESQPGQGACFTVLFPSAEAAMAAENRV